MPIRRPDLFAVDLLPQHLGQQVFDAVPLAERMGFQPVGHQLEIADG
jgi:hypothetical protein